MHPARPDAPEQSPTAGAPPAGATFLVVDDDPAIRALVAELVVAAGASVWGRADSGEAALSQLASAGRLPPDVVLVDVELPGIDGIETARRVLAGRSHAVVVLMSSRAERDLPADLLAGGVAGFVHKPALAPAVLAAISRRARRCDGRR